MTVEYVNIKVPVKVVRSLYVTGWYGRPGREGGMVHVKLKGERGPVCGTPQHEDAEFQWCAMRIEPRYVECQKCKRIIAPIVAGAVA